MATWKTTVRPDGDLDLEYGNGDETQHLGLINPKTHPDLLINWCLENRARPGDFIAVLERAPLVVMAHGGVA